MNAFEDYRAITFGSGQSSRFSRNWLPALILEHPLQFPHRAPCGYDGELSVIDFDELQSIPRTNSQSLANLQRNGDLAF
jgi:hypothetical protein